MGRRTIGPVDTIWLNMDRPNNLMIIDSVMFFEGPVDWERLAAVTRRRMIDRYPVFHQRPVQSRTHVGPPHWEDDPDFDIERHMVRVTLQRGDDAALQQYIEQFIPVPFDRNHPLWEIHQIDGYHKGAVVYTRLHHALADGIALARVLLSLTDDTPDGDLVAEAELEEAPAPMGVLEGALRVVEAAGSAVGAAATAAAHMVKDVPRLFDPHLAGDAFTQAERTGAIANKLLLGPKPHAPFSGVPTVAKRAVWSEPFPLEDVKRICRMSGATVNDVLMSAVAGALSTYWVEHDGEPEDVTTMVPVNVRPLDRPLPKELGNQFALVLVKLPTGVRSPFGRIAETKRRMDVIKHSPEVVLTFDLIKAIGRSGPELERFLVNFFAAKAIGVTTNVPGPTMTRYLGGAKIAGSIAWVPLSGDQTVGVSIFTYAGSVLVAFKVDAALVPDPEKLLEAFDAEIQELLRLAHAV